MLRKLSYILITLSSLGLISNAMGYALPSLRWFFNLNEIFGYVVMVLALVSGVAILVSGKRDIDWKPMTLRKFQRFKSMRRGYISFLILIFLIFLAMLDQTLVGKRALIVKYGDSYYFPAFSKKQYPGKQFGLEKESEADYRQLKEEWKAKEGSNWLIMPLIPWDPVLDSQDIDYKELVQGEDGLYYLEGSSKPFSGIAQSYYSEKPEQLHTQATFRKGKQSLRTEGFTIDGEKAVIEQWKEGKRVSQKFYDGVDEAAYNVAEAKPFIKKLYPALAPSIENSHYLGTNSQGWDILATLYGGFQVILKAAFIYLITTYAIGLTIGCLMGYLGGIFDITTQRFIEILANIPFLFVVMIINNRLDPENRTIGVIVGIMCIFSWIGMTYYMRTATYREKARDYIAASKLLGASPFRIIFLHILPNVISTIVTLIPFSFAAIATSLTALDFIGFGLPETYPSWGRTLSDGVSNLDDPWIVFSVFACMVTILLLITFIGEAIREAFDPKKFTYYK